MCLRPTMSMYASITIIQSGGDIKEHVTCEVPYNHVRFMNPIHFTSHCGSYLVLAVSCRTTAKPLTLKQNPHVPTTPLLKYGINCHWSSRGIFSHAASALTSNASQA